MVAQRTVWPGPLADAASGENRDGQTAGEGGLLASLDGQVAPDGGLLASLDGQRADVGDLIASPDGEAAFGARRGLRVVLGLALSGGAAHSAASAGVIEILDAAGVRPDVVVGTSGGAVIGAGYAADLPPQMITELVAAARWDHFGALRPGRRLAVYDPAPMASTLRRRFGDLSIEDLPRRFGALAYDIRSRRAVLLDHGSLVRALRASTAVPLLFPPEYVDGHPMGDGSIVSGLPAWAARRLGATFVIGVGFGREERPEAVWTRTRRYVLHAPERADEVPDLLIEPAVQGFRRWRTVDVPAIIEEGRRAARAAVPLIQARLAELNRATAELNRATAELDRATAELDGSTPELADRPVSSADDPAEPPAAHATDN